MLRKILFSAILIATLSGSCSFNKPPTHILSEPNWSPGLSTNNNIKIVIASTHNFQGSIFSENVKFPLNQSLKYNQLKVGGISILKSYLDILKSRYQNNLILLDTGYIFSKSNLNLKENRKILKIFELLNYDAINLTDRDYKELETINPLKLKIPFITSNIINLEKNKPIDKYGTAPFKIIKRKGIKIGIIAITSFQRLEQKKFRGIFFEDPILSFLKIRKIFKKKNINIVLLMPSVENQQDLIQLIKRLPPNSVDAIIAGNTKTSNNTIAGVPILQNSGQGKYISRIELTYNLQKKKIIKDQMIQYKPVKICHRFFRITMDCHFQEIKEIWKSRYKVIAKSAYQIVPAKFLGHEIKKNRLIEDIINK